MTWDHRNNLEVKKQAWSSHSADVLVDIHVLHIGMKYTAFTWLNTAATISPVTKIDVATIRGRRLLH